ncbi:MAG: glycine cleavage system protein R [Thermoguttaceae bacterium]
MGKHLYVLNVLTKDHPGIVAGVSSAVGELNGTIISCSQTVLHGYFTLISIVSIPEDYEPEKLAEKIASHDSLGKGYLISAAKMDDQTSSLKKPEATNDGFVITAFGEGEGSVIERFSRYLADHDVNIVDLFGDQTGDEFVLIGQLAVPQHYDPRVLQDDLEEIGREINFTVKMQHRNIFVATNQIRLDE